MTRHRAQHRRTGRVICTACACVVAMSASITLAAADEGDVLDLVRAPNFEQVRISPDGRRLSTLRHVDGEESIAVLDLESLEPLAVRHFAGSTGIWGYDWASDERLLVYPTRRLAEISRNAYPTGEIIGMDPDGDDVTVLFGYRAEKEAMLASGRVIDLVPEDPDYVIVEAHEFEARGDFTTAWRMNVHDGRVEEIARAPIRDGRFVPDSDHEIRIVTGDDDAARSSNWFRAAPGSSFERVEGDANRLVPIAAAVDGDGRPTGAFITLDDRAGAPKDGDLRTRGVSAWDPVTGRRDTLFAHDTVDTNDVLLDSSGQIYAVRFVDHYPNWFYPQQTHPLARIHMMLRGRYREDDVSIVASSADDRIIVARSHGPQNPGTFHVVDVQGPRLLHEIPSRPWLAREDLAPSEPIAVTVRDGTEIRGYLTTHAAADAGPRPLVVLIHGGPHGVYDSWDFDPEAQLLARAGYTVLQVNFRGSGGRGAAFEVAGHGEWGGRMQDDVTDAVHWAIASGTADPERICIMGASYGAYAAMVGAYRDPGLYQCAIGNAGVYDLELMFEAGDVKTRMSGMSYLERVLGEDETLLRARSPVHNAARIRIPVLLGHGEQDDRAPIQHANRLRSALEVNDRDVRWFRRAGEGHGFVGERNRTEWLLEVLDFLDEHIGADIPDARADVAQGAPPD